MKISVDRRIYSDEAISKTIYHLADRFSIGRNLASENTEVLDVTLQKGIDISEADVRSTIFDTLNDYKLRDIIEKETHDIRVILYAKAFGEFDDISASDIG